MPISLIRGLGNEMSQFVFELKWSVADNVMVVIVSATHYKHALSKLINKYPTCPNIDYLGQADDVIN